MVKIEIRTPDKNDKVGHTTCDIDFKGNIDQLASVMVELEHVVRQAVLQLNNGHEDILYLFAGALVHNRYND